MSAYPHRVTDELDRSLWSQVVYLSRNIEWFIGGNHLLQDLCSLLVAATRYEGDVATRIVAEASRHLSEALPRQLTADGCHYEISGAYHLQVMVMVSQAMASLLSAGFEVPANLVGCLRRMAGFAEWMRLPGGGYPMWGDSARNSVEPLDEVLALSRGVLRAANGNVLRGAAGGEADPLEFDEAGRGLGGYAETELPFPAAQLMRSAERGAAESARGSEASQPSNPLPQQKLTSFGAEPNLTNSYQEMLGRPSGLEILRAGDFILVVDAAATAPDDLPAHGHADSLNVDVYLQGEPVFIETGTSVYEAGPERDHERGTAAHNTVEIGGTSQTEMWGSFRAGRLARTFDRASGESDGWRWVTASHDGYVRNHGAVHSRWVGLRGRDVVVLDRISVTGSDEPVPFTARFHLAPNVLARELDDDRMAVGVGEGREMVVSFGSSANVSALLKRPGESRSWYSHGFGSRVARAAIEVSGAAKAGVTHLCTHMTFAPRAVEFVGEKGVVGLLEEDRFLVAWVDSGGQIRLTEPTCLPVTEGFGEVLTTRTSTSTSRLRKVLS